MFNEIDYNILMFNVCRRISNIWCGFYYWRAKKYLEPGSKHYIQKHLKIFENSSESLKKIIYHLALTVQQIISSPKTYINGWN